MPTDRAANSETDGIDDAQTAAVEAQIERLTPYAEERWGQEYNFDITRFTDGDVDVFARHVFGRVPDDEHELDCTVLDVGRLFIGPEGRIGYDRTHQPKQQVVTTLARKVIEDVADADRE